MISLHLLSPSHSQSSLIPIQSRNQKKEIVVDQIKMNMVET